jgi:hypothetical protein
MKFSPEGEISLMTEIWDTQISDDLDAFVRFAYPWGKKDTPLENHKEPRVWQRDYLMEMTQHIRDQRDRVEQGLLPIMWRKAVASGRGTGKSALVSWITDYFLSCRIGSTSIITANTEPQLKSRTFAELGRWTTMLINSHWFDANVLSVYPAPWFKKSIEDSLQIDTGYYYAQGQLWSEENPDAFAGVHNPYGVNLLFDEASGIPNSIFNVSQGFFTEPEIWRFWNLFSNPRRNSGAFFDIFNDPAIMEKWKRLQIDSRTVDGIDQYLFEQIIEQHGIDSDVVRVEILGQFPKAGQMQFISNDLVYDAQSRELQTDNGAALIMGVDPSRMGGDEFVVKFRQGRDGRSFPTFRWDRTDNVKSADKVAQLIDDYKPDAVCIDSGAGGGVIDILRSRKYRITEVSFGSSGGIDRQWANWGTQLYANIRDWLPGGCLDKDPRLFTDLTARDYNYYGKAKDQQILEPKEIFKAKVGRSPGDGDAFALTFATKVARRDSSIRARRGRILNSSKDFGED